MERVENRVDTKDLGRSEYFWGPRQWGIKSKVNYFTYFYLICLTYLLVEFTLNAN
jgi:hypothetical protein